VSEPSPRRRPGRNAQRRPSPAALGVVRVDPDFLQEYPDGDATSTEAYASLCRTGQALLQELDRAIVAAIDMPQTALTALAVVDGAGEPLTPSQIGDRVLVASATMTSTLDLLEYRRWIVRTPNPADRRSVLVEITHESRAAADQLLPGIRRIELKVLAGLNESERKQLLNLLAKVLARAADVDSEPPERLEGRRNRPARLTHNG
jgi:DNA-binding MarR family transcriptional regulator